MGGGTVLLYGVLVAAKKSLLVVFMALSVAWLAVTLLQVTMSDSLSPRARKKSLGSLASGMVAFILMVFWPRGWPWAWTGPLVLLLTVGLARLFSGRNVSRISPGDLGRTLIIIGRGNRPMALLLAATVLGLLFRVGYELGFVFSYFRHLLVYGLAGHMGL